VNILEGDLG